MIPRATYRIQFHAKFTFADAARLAPYFDELGISHLYASPITTARAGSMHGYDVVDPSRINPELGGEEGFLHLAEALRSRGIGIILDIVPNHMAVGGADNHWWLDVLARGRNSDYAHYFDIDFDTRQPGLHGKILAPFLATPYGEALRNGDLRLVRNDPVTGYAIAYQHHRFPIHPDDQNDVAKDPDRFTTPDSLHALLERQCFRLAWWRNASDEINWRRFFDVTELAGVSVEHEDVFEAIHALPFDLYARGLIDGVRVDHVDGLTNPAAYCLTLRARLDALAPQRPAGAAPGPAYIVVEKILAQGEELPATWNVDGTTGYDFMNLVSAVQHNPSGEAELTNLCTSLTGRPADFDIEEAAARHELLHDAFTAQLDRTASAFHRIAIADPATRDISLTALRRGLVRVITHMRAYRSYATGRPDGAAPGAPFDRAIAAAKQAAPQDAYVFDFVAQTQGASNTADAVRRFNQLTAPVTAKAVEDTAFYRYGRLLSRNDIGFDPRQFALPADDFHAAIARRAATHPNAMLATATHDHKRGEDVRARLAALSNHPTEWRDSVASWFTLNAPRRPEGLAPDDEYQLYQTLVGAWPLDLAATDTKAGRAFATRVMKWQQKALREAKLRSSWTAPNTGYEDAAKAFTAAVLEAPEFLAALEAFVGRIAHEGAMNGLMQVVLRMTLPGVPDLYQGTEFWDFSLVDPDNRRPVDYEARTSALSSDADLLATWRDGRIKQSIIRRLLALRRSDPEFFALADYQPMALDGNTVAFTRRHAGKTLIVAAPARPLHAGDLATVLSEPALVLWGPA